MLQTAARDHGISAVIAQVPHVCGPSTLAQLPPLTALRLGLAGLRDLIGGAFGRYHYTPLVGRPGEVTGLSSPEAWDGCHGRLEPGAPWENRTRSRVLLELTFYNPILQARKIASPALVIGGRRDTIVPAAAAQAAARRIPKGRFALLDSNHFEPHAGEVFAENIALQLDFLREIVPPVPRMAQRAAF